VDAVVTRTRNRAGSTGWELLSLAELAAECAESIEKETGRAPSAFDHAVFANYRTASQRFFASALRVPADRILVGPKAEFGHCFSADPLITLARARETGALTAGETALVSSIGPHSWSLAALTCR
jgi:3-oxoacyl-[acyl-carrier-protein] synthase-3